MDSVSFDIAVLGGGPGGTAAAKALARGGKTVALVSDNLGGECLNFGCIPTKTYLFAAELFEKISAGSAFGIEASNVRLNWEFMKKRRTEVVGKLQKGLRFTVEKSGAKIIEGRGVFIDPHTIEIAALQGPMVRLNAEFVIIATGSAAWLPPGFSVNGKFLTNKEILDLPKIPSSLLVIGGGAVGVEFASLFAALGSKVTIAEMGERLLLHEDADLGTELERIFVRKGITILKNTKIAPQETAAYEKVLVATGRSPALSGIALSKTGVQFDEKIGIATNEFCQTNVAHIFAIGDVAGKVLLAYTAEREGEIAASKILGGAPIAPIRYETVPNTIFSLPEVASVGISEQEAKKRGIDCIVSKSLASANSKALIVGARDGFCKIVAEKQTQKILGIHMIGEKVTELIAEASLALTAGMTLPVFAQNIHSHPILGEIVKEAERS